MKRPSPSGGRAFVLYVVLIVVTIGALTAGTVVYAAQAQRAAADAAARRVQARALAWSGVQAVMEELRSGRDELIRGGDPDVQDEWTMFVESDGRRAVARLVAGADGQMLESESSKVDVNSAPEAMLVLVPGLDEEIAKRVVASRNGRKFLSVRELAEIEGLRTAFAGASKEEEGRPSVQDAFVPPEDAATSQPLTNLLTVFSFDPNVQAGMGRNAESHIGVRRIGLSGKWSDRLGKAISERFDEGASNVVKGLMEQGTKFEKESDVVKVLRRFNVQPKDWPEVLDAFCGDPGLYRLGRVDALRAQREILACVPGVDAAAAEQIALRREKLSAEQKMSLVWLIEENILTQDQFELAVDHLTMRSTQWRVVIEAGFETEDRDDSSEHSPLAERVLVEAVIDVSSERPRVAYLREITMADAAKTLGPLWTAPERSKRELEERAAATPPVAPVSSGGSGRRGRAANARTTPPETAGGADGADGADSSTQDKDPRLGRWTPGQQ